MLCEVSNHGAKDVRAMHLEEKLKAVGHKELWGKLPVRIAMDPQKILRPVKPSEIEVTDVDHTKTSKLIDVVALKELPRRNWDQTLALLEKP